MPGDTWESVAAAAWRLATADLPFSAARSFAGHRGCFLVYTFPRDDAGRTRDCHRACRMLELADEVTRRSPLALVLRFDGDYQFAVEAAAGDTAERRLKQLTSHILAGADSAPAPLVPVEPGRAPRLPAEVEADWRQVRGLVDTFEDGLGRHVDRGIRETVAALLIHGLLTQASCEGHLGWGERTPWVTVGYDEQAFASIPDPTSRQRRARTATRRAARELELLVAAFNENRKVPAWQRLVVVSPRGELPATLECYGGCRLFDHSWPERRPLLTELQHEMTALARYLRGLLLDPSRPYSVWR